MVVPALPGVSIAKSIRSFLSDVLSVLLVGNLENALAACYIISTGWITSKLNSDIRSRHCASRLQLSDSFRIHLSES